MWVKFPNAKRELIRNTLYNLEGKDIRLISNRIIIFSAEERSLIVFSSSDEAEETFARLEQKLNVTDVWSN